MELGCDFSERHIFKEAFLAVRNGKVEIIGALLPKLKSNLYISFFSSTRCRCGYELEMLTCEANTFPSFNLERITDIIQRGNCCCFMTADSVERLVAISLLHFACYYGHLEIVKLLIDHGANVCSETSLSRYTPLQMAICSKKDEQTIFDIMSLLLENGAKPSQRDAIDGGTLLHIAVKRDYQSIVELLLQHNCDIDMQDKDSKTALYHAVYVNALDLVKILVDNGADVNTGPPHDPVPLITAVRRGECELVSALLSTPLCNIEIDKPGGESRFLTRKLTALHYAVYQGQIDLVTLLLTHKANVNCVDSEGNTALCSAVFVRERHIFRELIKFGADVNICNAHGYGAIHHAAWDGEAECVDLLLQHGCDHDTRTSDGNTPLALACHGGQMSIARQLMTLEVNVNNSDKDLDTPLHYASYNRCVETCRRLVELGADPNARNRINVTPLWNAVYRSARSVVRYLIELNVSLSVASCGFDQESQREPVTTLYDEPRMPLYAAFEHCDDPHVAALLIIAGVDVSQEKWLRSMDLPVFHKEPGSAPHVDFLRAYTESPVSLKRLCRDHMRVRLGSRLAQAIPQCELPLELTDYLLLKQDLDLCEAGTLNLNSYKFN